MHAPAPIAAWADPQDPRHAITPDQLLRMTSGLDMGQTLHDVSPFDPAAQMLFIEHDMAAVAERAPLAHTPGAHWNYTDPNTLLLSRMVRNAFPAESCSCSIMVTGFCTLPNGDGRTGSFWMMASSILTM